MTTWMIEKGLVELGGLNSDILEVKKGLREGFVGSYDGDDFYFRSHNGDSVLRLLRDNPFLVNAFEKFIGFKHCSRKITSEEIVYEWNKLFYFEKG